MRRFGILVIVLLVAATVWAQQPTAAPKDVVIVTKETPGTTIRINVVDSLGKQTDAGQYIKIDVYNQLFSQAQAMGQLLNKHFGEIIQLINPDLAKALADSNTIMIDRRTIKFEQPKATKKKGK